MCIDLVLFSAIYIHNLCFKDNDAHGEDLEPSGGSLYLLDSLLYVAILLLCEFIHG
ncbi:unnamed protein product [Brassica oleracea]